MRKMQKARNDGGPCRSCRQHGRAAISRAVVCIYLDVVVGKVAGIDLGQSITATEVDTHRDLGLRHHAGTILFPVGRSTTTIFGHQHVVEPDLDAIDIQIGDAGVANGITSLPTVQMLVAGLLVSRRSDAM